jgi:hypothetical protein
VGEKIKEGGKAHCELMRQVFCAKMNNACSNSNRMCLLLMVWCQGFI